MGDYEELCEQFGLRPYSEEDYETLTDILVSGAKLEEETDQNRIRSCLPFVFMNFQEASEWSKKNHGKSFTRTPNGMHFMPVGGKTSDFKEIDASPKSCSSSNGRLTNKDPISIFLRGEAAINENWLPGSYPGFRNNKNRNNALKDMQMDKELFLPRFLSLAPSMTNVQLLTTKIEFDAKELTDSISSKFYESSALPDLKELLDLIRGKLIRVRRWYITQAASRGLTKQYSFLPAFNVTQHEFLKHEQRHGRVPPDLFFWHKLGQIVEKELKQRS